MRKAHKIIFRKLTRLVGRSSCTGEDSTADWMSQEKGQEQSSMDQCGSRRKPVAGLCGHGNEPSYCTKSMKFLDSLSNY